MQQQVLDVPLSLIEKKGINEEANANHPDDDEMPEYNLLDDVEIEERK